MDNAAIKKLITPKFLFIGLGIIAVIGITIIGLNASQTVEKQRDNAPVSTPAVSTSKEVVSPPIPPDKQIEGQIIVKFKNQYTDAQINEHLTQYNASIIKTIEGINSKVVRVPTGQENVIIEKLRTDPYVETADGDYTTHIMYVPNDTDFTKQWGLNNTGQTINGQAGIANDDIRAELAWDVTKGKGVKVAVLDTGVNLTHPEFANKVVAQKAFVGTTVEDGNGHGTHVSGIILAATNNGQGVAGTCPECVLIIGKIMPDSGMNGSTSDSINGITWAADQGAKVINLSIGTTASSSNSNYKTAVDYAMSKGAIVVSSAGNCGGSAFSLNGCTAENQISYPGGTAGVVSVASTDNRDQLSSFSDHGTWIKVGAPGSNIYSTLPIHDSVKGTLNYGSLSGTSMASPMVAGVLGLIWSVPAYGTSNTAVINRLYATADKIAGTGTNWSEGRVNAAKAVGAGTTAGVTPGSTVPSPVCVGGNQTPPCATIAVVSPVTGGDTTPGASGSTAPSGSVTNPTISTPVTTVSPGTGGGNPSPNPCGTIGQVVYNRSNGSGTQQVAYKAHIKTETSINSFGGFLSRFFEFLLRLIEALLRLIGIGGNPCLVQPPAGSPGTPGQNPGGGVPGQNPNPSVPVTSPSVSNAPTTSTAPGVSNAPGTSTAPGVSTVPPASGGGAPGVSTVPPASGGGAGSGSGSGSGGGTAGGGGSTPADPNVPNAGGYQGACNLGDTGNGWSYCLGDGPNNGRCLPPGGSCNAPLKPYPDGSLKGFFCNEPLKQEYTPPAAGAARGVCRVCPAGGSVKQGALACTCDEAGFVATPDKTKCTKQVQGCVMDPSGMKCASCTSDKQQVAPDGLSCVDKPATPGTGGGTGGGTCVARNGCKAADGACCDGGAGTCKAPFQTPVCVRKTPQKCGTNQYLASDNYCVTDAAYCKQNPSTCGTTICTSTQYCSAGGTCITNADYCKQFKTSCGGRCLQ